MTRSLGTYRVDVHRTLESLIEKGMVEVLLDTPQAYIAVPIKEAINSALNKHMNDYRKMEEKTRELVEIAQNIHLEPTEGISKFRLVRSLNKAKAITSRILKAAQNEVIFVTTPDGANSIVEYGTLADFKSAIKRKVSMRCITNISHQNLDAILDIKDYLEIRLHTDYRGICFLVTDGKESLMVLRFDALQPETDPNNIWFWSNDTDFAAYLKATFEILWAQSDIV